MSGDLSGGHVAVTLTPVAAGGASRRLPVEVGGNGLPIPVALQPTESFPQAIVFGDSTRRSAQDTAQIIWTDWTGGAGQYEYTETEGIVTYTDSTLDTRYQQSLVLPPRATPLGGAVAALGIGQRGRYLGYPTARHITWRAGTNPASTYDPTTDRWSSLFPTLGYTTDVALAYGYTWALGPTALWRTTDGATWESVAVPGGGGTFVALARYDNKLCVLKVDAGTTTLHVSVTPRAAAATVAWTAGGTFLVSDVTVGANERPLALFVWRLPTNLGAPALWCRTTHRLLYYEEEGGVNAWRDYRTTTHAPSRGFPVPVLVWGRTNNLYTTPRDRQQEVIEFTGNTEDRLGPNKRGGLPAGRRTQFYTLDANDHVLLACGDNYAAPGAYAPDAPPATHGRVWAMGETQGWHCVYATDGPVYGAWVGEGELCVATAAGILALPFPDEATIPRNAAVGTRAYQTGQTAWLETAWTDGGTPYVNKRALWVFVDARRPDDGAGLPGGTSLVLQYMTDRDPTWAALATLGPGDPFPANVPFRPADGRRSVGGKRIRFRIGMASGDPAATPNLATLALHFVRRPKRRYAYTCRVDLRDDAPAFRNAAGTYNGHSAAALRAWLLGLVDNEGGGGDDPLVAFAYGGYGDPTHPTRRAVAQAELVVTPLEEAGSGLGRYTLTLRDLSPPADG